MRRRSIPEVEKRARRLSWRENGGGIFGGIVAFLKSLGLFLVGMYCLVGGIAGIGDCLIDACRLVFPYFPWAEQTHPAELAVLVVWVLAGLAFIGDSFRNFSNWGDSGP